ncbi:MAG: PilW family protein [Steroidobacteraceae bacterium]|jgi:type IV pilus assembly protein PilW
MSTARHPASPCPVRRARGFTLLELMVAVAIAMFLLAGLVTVFDNTRVTYANQQALAQMQDQQRFAMQLLTSVIESGGYYNNPTGDTVNSALPATAPFGAGQPFYGLGTAGAAPGDTIYVRFRTASGDGIINCTGGQNTSGIEQVYTNEFSIVGGQLVCSLNGGVAVPLVSGVTNLQIYYGVKRLTPFTDYNVDTYATAANMNVLSCPLTPGCDWQQVSAVRVILTFTNPLAKQTGQPATLVFERVIQVMARAGDYT